MAMSWPTLHINFKLIEKIFANASYRKEHVEHAWATTQDNLGGDHVVRLAKGGRFDACSPHTHK
jgi:hypothetical protein